MSIIKAQAGAVLKISGTVRSGDTPVDLTDTSIEATTVVGSVKTNYNGAVADGGEGAFSVRFDETVTRAWPINSFVTVRLTRRVNGDVLPLGVMRVLVE